MTPETNYLIVIVGLSLLVLLVLAAGAANKRRLDRPKKRKPRFITITNSKVYFAGRKMGSLKAKTPNGKPAGDLVKSNLAKAVHDDRRSAQREKLTTPVDFVKQGRLFKEISADFSSTGMFLMTRKPDLFNVNDTLTLTFQTPDGSPHKTRGNIVRKAQKGFGIQFAAA